MKDCPFYEDFTYWNPSWGSTPGLPISNLSDNSYSGAFAYSMPHGVTITLAATKSETSTTDFAAFEILREVVKYVTPDSPIAF